MLRSIHKLEEIRVLLLWLFFFAWVFVIQYEAGCVRRDTTHVLRATRASVEKTGHFPKMTMVKDSFYLDIHVLVLLFKKKVQKYIRNSCHIRTIDPWEFSRAHFCFFLWWLTYKWLLSPLTQTEERRRHEMPIIQGNWIIWTVSGQGRCLKH